ncbi:hypothetical protein FOZ62_017605, partial [Perkinsus olseni]
YFYLAAKAEDRPPETAPTFIQMFGGPGISSVGGALTSTAPCYVSESGESLVTNQYSWTKNANGIWIDAPGGVGLSDELNDDTISEYVQRMTLTIEGILKRHPYLGKELYVIGHSFDSSIAILVASQLMELSLPVKGVYSVDGLNGPAQRCSGYLEVATRRSLVEDPEIREMKQALESCRAKLEECQTNWEFDSGACKSIQALWSEVFLNPVKDNFVYDMRTVPAGECFFFKFHPGDVEVFLNQKSIREQLGVSREFKALNKQVLYKYTQPDTTPALVSLLDAGLKVLIAVGSEDYIVNTNSTLMWMRTLRGEYNYSTVVLQQATTLKTSRDETVGDVRKDIFDNRAKLAFIEITEAGHMPYMNKPAEMEWLLGAFIDGNLWSGDAGLKQTRPHS